MKYVYSVETEEVEKELKKVTETIMVHKGDTFCENNKLNECDIEGIS